MGGRWFFEKKLSGAHKEVKLLELSHLVTTSSARSPRHPSRPSWGTDPKENAAQAPPRGSGRGCGEKQTQPRTSEGTEKRPHTPTARVLRGRGIVPYLARDGSRDHVRSLPYPVDGTGHAR